MTAMTTMTSINVKPSRPGGLLVLRRGAVFWFVFIPYLLMEAPNL